ncbi:two-component system, NarL family, nitrate/nitrite sensor histidine kinase NarX [Paracoccus aminovorans]|uniref:histidine kinase n=1 Tax=Paracoccus aminovorans TaxID=34004 RepID=A0A1I3DF42_9RHOB|nr:histidine kinase [Paracoccus aminovorans]CQR84052.1 histidine kinase, NarQ [Paracoccus aminovorans]SFH85354.1 two-component system, NarL family, nitrate/nitrite sensor histidine kinase NarX [Paracoccus aminovorans]
MPRTAVQKSSGRMMPGRGPLRGVAARPSRWLPGHPAGLHDLRRRPIYARLLVLLCCIAVTAILILAGSLFLGDYIPANRAEAAQARQHELFWRAQSEAARPAAPIGSVGWTPVRGNRALAAELARAAAAEREIARALAEGAPPASWRPMARDLAASYLRIGTLLQRELDIRRTAVSVLQLAGLLFLLFCIARIALDLRRTLVERLDRIGAAVPGAAAPPSVAADEMARLEGRVTGLVERLAAEAASAGETRDALRRMAGAQDFLARFVELINTWALDEAMLRKVLYALERALDADNAAILYTEDGPVLSHGRSLHSSREPLAPGDETMNALRRSDASTLVETDPEDSRVRTVAAAFVEPSGETGVLLVETDAERLPDAAGMQMLAIAAGLLSITARFQNHDREGRRLAVLEERAAIARELHDSLAQSLSFMKIQLARLQSGSHAGAADSRAVIAELRTGLDTAYRELRELLATFRVHMDVRGLRYALQSAIDEFSQRSDLAISLDNQLDTVQLTVNEEFHILQIVREALSNILHHADAENAAIALSAGADRRVRIVIEDDGIGYEPATEGRDHHGHAIMTERACSLGGTLEVEARPQGGTRVRLTFTPKAAQ